jgi:RNA polymerase primary sigma factor
MKRRGFVLFSHLRLAGIEKLFKFRRYKMQEECLAFSTPSVVRAAGKRNSPFAAEIVIECELLDKIGNPPKICALQAGISRPTIGSCGQRLESCHPNGTMGIVPHELLAVGKGASDERNTTSDHLLPWNNLMTRPRRPRGPSVQSPLETYLREINETPLLSADEEKELAHRIEAGDNEARDRMVRANLRLVVNIARSYTGKGLGLQDLIEEGNLGLLRAVEGFDPRMNTRFSTYASYWIKQSIKRALVNTAKTIRIPAYMVELLAKWRRATSKLQDELGRPPTHEEVAKSLNLPKKKLAIIKKAIRVYNAAPQTDQPEAGWSLDEMVMDGNSKSPDLEMVEADDLKHVLELLDKMDPREATVLRMRFGLVEGEEPKTLKEIGECLGLTRERVRQIESEALSKLSESMQGE